MVSVKDQLQSVSGDLLVARIALDSDWTDVIEEQDTLKKQGYVLMVKLLTMAQTNVDDARTLLESLS